MPDTRFSWPMLKEHLRKYLWIYLVGVAACLVITSLLWTTTRPRPTNEQGVVVYMVGGYADPEALNGISADMLARAGAEDANLTLVDFQWVQYEGGDGDYTGSVVLMTRISLGDGDVFIASEAGAEALLRYDVLAPLDGLLEGGWLAEYGPEPWRVEIEDEDTGETRAFVAGVRLDGFTGLRELGAFDNSGAMLCLATTSANPETTRRAVEVLLEDLAKEADHAGTEGH